MYDRGFFGGKFLPFHRGHQYCIQTAAQQCRELVVIFFADSEEERTAAEPRCGRELLVPENRLAALRRFCAAYPNVRLVTLDCAVMHRQARADGTDLWDAETEYVKRAVGDFQAVYSSEPGYDAYFRRAYPFAKHIVIDAPRVHVPISGTQIRALSREDAKKWL